MKVGDRVRRTRYGDTGTIIAVLRVEEHRALYLVDYDQRDFFRDNQHYHRGNQLEVINEKMRKYREKLPAHQPD